MKLLLQLLHQQQRNLLRNPRTDGRRPPSFKSVRKQRRTARVWGLARWSINRDQVVWGVRLGFVGTLPFFWGFDDLFPIFGHDDTAKAHHPSKLIDKLFFRNNNKNLLQIRTLLTILWPSPSWPPGASWQIPSRSFLPSWSSDDGSRGKGGRRVRKFCTLFLPRWTTLNYIIFCTRRSKKNNFHHIFSCISCSRCGH